MISPPILRSVRIRLATIAASVITAAVACNQAPAGRVPVYPVKGKVTLKGVPLADALVIFELTAAPSSGGGTTTIRSTGRTDKDGNFQLMTYQGNDGAPAGNHLVGISGMPPRSEANIFDMPKGSIAKGNPDRLKGRYVDPKSSGLTAVVKEGENEIPVFDLK